MFCQNCGSAAIPGTTYCGNCGPRIVAAPLHESRRNLAAIIMKVIGVFLATPLLVLFPSAWLSGTSIHPHFKTLWVGGEISIIVAGVTYLVAHVLDFGYLGRRAGMASWILELLGTIAILAVGIIAFFCAKYDEWNGFDFSHSSAGATCGLEFIAVAMFAIALLLAALRARSNRG